MSINSDSSNYLQRLGHAFDFHNNPLEATARTILPITMASLALNALATEVHQPIPPVYEHAGTPPHKEIIKIAPGEHLVPATIGRTTLQGPGLRLTFPQAFARDFKAAPFKVQQRQELNHVAGEFAAVFKRLPKAKLAIQIEGLSSDESDVESKHGDMNLGVVSPHNNGRLARARAGQVGTYLNPKLTHRGQTTFSLTGHEAILNSTQISQINSEAQAHHTSRAHLIKSYDAVPQRAHSQVLDRLLKDNRGAVISSTITTTEKPYVAPCDQVVREIHTPGSKIAQEVPGSGKWDLYLLPLILPPLPRRRRRNRVPPEPVTDPQRCLSFEDIPADAKRHPKIPSFVKKGAGLVALAALLPFPWLTLDGRSNKTERGACGSTEVKPGATGHIFLNLASIAAYRLLEHKPKWNKQLDTGDSQFTPDKTTTKHVAYQEILVDKHGQILDRIPFPATSNTTYSYSK